MSRLKLARYVGGTIGITKNTGVPKIKWNNTGVPLMISHNLKNYKKLILINCITTNQTRSQLIMI